MTTPQEPLVTAPEAFTLIAILTAFVIVAWHGIDKGFEEKIAKMEMQVVLKQLEQGCQLAPVEKSQ